MKIITWNAQGAGTKWTTSVLSLLKKCDVLCLQETGISPPGTAVLHDDRINRYDGFQSYTWQPSARVDPIYMLFYTWTDSRAGGINRCNLAILTKIEPTGVELFFGGLRDHRPCIAWKINGLWIGTLHAISGGGYNVPGMLRTGARIFDEQPFIIPGDYNREPDSYNKSIASAIPASVAVLATDDYTHPTASTGRPNSKLDYAIASVGLTADPGIVMSNFDNSDHYPVHYVATYGLKPYHK